MYKYLKNIKRVDSNFFNQSKMKFIKNQNLNTSFKKYSTFFCLKKNILVLKFYFLIINKIKNKKFFILSFVFFENFYKKFKQDFIKDEKLIFSLEINDSIFIILNFLFILLFNILFTFLQNSKTKIIFLKFFVNQRFFGIKDLTFGSFAVNLLPFASASPKRKEAKPNRLAEAKEPKARLKIARSKVSHKAERLTKNFEDSAKRKKDEEVKAKPMQRSEKAEHIKTIIYNFNKRFPNENKIIINDFSSFVIKDFKKTEKSNKRFSILEFFKRNSIEFIFKNFFSIVLHLESSILQLPSLSVLLLNSSTGSFASSQPLFHFSSAFVSADAKKRLRGRREGKTELKEWLQSGCEGVNKNKNTNHIFFIKNIKNCKINENKKNYLKFFCLKKKELFYFMFFQHIYYYINLLFHFYCFSFKKIQHIILIKTFLIQNSSKKKAKFLDSNSFMNRPLSVPHGILSELAQKEVQHTTSPSPPMGDFASLLHLSSMDDPLCISERKQTSKFFNKFSLNNNRFFLFNNKNFLNNMIFEIYNKVLFLNNYFSIFINLKYKPFRMHNLIKSKALKNFKLTQNVYNIKLLLKFQKIFYCIEMTYFLSKKNFYNKTKKFLFFKIQKLLWNCFIFKQKSFLPLYSIIFSKKKFSDFYYHFNDNILEKESVLSIFIKKKLLFFRCLHCRRSRRSKGSAFLSQSEGAAVRSRRSEGKDKAPLSASLYSPKQSNEPKRSKRDKAEVSSLLRLFLAPRYLRFQNRSRFFARHRSFAKRKDRLRHAKAAAPSLCERKPKQKEANRQQRESEFVLRRLAFLQPHWLCLRSASGSEPKAQSKIARSKVNRKAERLTKNFEDHFSSFAREKAEECIKRSGSVQKEAKEKKQKKGSKGIDKSKIASLLHKRQQKNKYKAINMVLNNVKKSNRKIEIILGPLKFGLSFELYCNIFSFYTFNSFIKQSIKTIKSNFLFYDCLNFYKKNFFNLNNYSCSSFVMLLKTTQIKDLNKAKKKQRKNETLKKILVKKNIIYTLLSKKQNLVINNQNFFYVLKKLIEILKQIRPLKYILHLKRYIFVTKNLKNFTFFNIILKAFYPNYKMSNFVLNSFEIENYLKSKILFLIIKYTKINMSFFKKNSISFFLSELKIQNNFLAILLYTLLFQYTNEHTHKNSIISNDDISKDINQKILNSYNKKGASLPNFASSCFFTPQGAYRKQPIKHRLFRFSAFSRTFGHRRSFAKRKEGIFSLRFFGGADALAQLKIFDSELEGAFSEAEETERLQKLFRFVNQSEPKQKEAKEPKKRSECINPSDQEKKNKKEKNEYIRLYNIGFYYGSFFLNFNINIFDIVDILYKSFYISFLKIEKPKLFKIRFIKSSIRKNKYSYKTYKINLFKYKFFKSVLKKLFSHSSATRFALPRSFGIFGIEDFRSRKRVGSAEEAERELESEGSCSFTLRKEANASASRFFASASFRFANERLPSHGEAGPFASRTSGCARSREDAKTALSVALSPKQPKKPKKKIKKKIYIKSIFSLHTKYKKSLKNKNLFLYDFKKFFFNYSFFKIYKNYQINKIQNKNKFFLIKKWDPLKGRYQKKSNYIWKKNKISFFYETNYLNIFYNNKFSNCLITDKNNIFILNSKYTIINKFANATIAWNTEYNISDCSVLQKKIDKNKENIFYLKKRKILSLEQMYSLKKNGLNFKGFFLFLRYVSNTLSDSKKERLNTKEFLIRDKKGYLIKKQISILKNHKVQNFHQFFFCCVHFCFTSLESSNCQPSLWLLRQPLHRTRSEGFAEMKGSRQRNRVRRSGKIDKPKMQQTTEYFNFKINTGLIPSKINLKKHLNLLKNIILKYNSQAQKKLLYKLSYRIMNWSYYYKIVTNSQLFFYCDKIIYKLLWKWACRNHPNKSKKWIQQKYFFSLKNKKWVFGILPKNFDSKSSRKDIFYLPFHNFLIKI